MESKDLQRAEETVAAVAPALRSALSVPLRAKLPPAARADVLRAVVTATRLCGAEWLTAPGAEVGAGGGTGGGAEGSAEGGTLLTLLLQLCSVELQICLHDQPSDEVSDHVLGVLPASCSLVEEALFRLHSDAGDEEDDEEEGGREGCVTVGSTGVTGVADGFGGGLDPWLSAMTDEQVVKAQQAFQRALMVSLDYLETLRTERAAEGGRERRGWQNTAAPPVARLVSAVAQPSAPPDDGAVRPRVLAASSAAAGRRGKQGRVGSTSSRL